MSNGKENPPASPKWQFEFRLRSLFYATALIASGMALSPSTIWFSLMVLLVWGIVFSSGRVRVVFGLTLLLYILVFALLPTVQASREARRCHACLNNMKQIMLAAMIYEVANGRFPTDRIVVLDDGTVLRHSWRVEILPMLEYKALYDQYDFKEPWDGPNNSKLASSMPYVFHCPARNQGDTPHNTSYKLINGPGTAFEVGKKVSLDDVKDGASSTIGLIEDHANPTHWMEPEDYTAQQAARVMNSVTMDTGVHFEDWPLVKEYTGCNFALINGGAIGWPPERDMPVEIGAFLIDDGHLFDPDAREQSILKIKYGVCITLAIYLMLIIVPVFFLSGSPPNLMATREID